MHELQKFLPRPSQNFAQKRLHYISLDFTENLDFCVILLKKLHRFNAEHKQRKEVIEIVVTFGFVIKSFSKYI